MGSRDPAAARLLLAAIEDMAAPGAPDAEHSSWRWRRHTHTIYRHGLEHLPDNVELVHTPGARSA